MTLLQGHHDRQGDMLTMLMESLMNVQKVCNHGVYFYYLLGFKSILLINFSDDQTNRPLSGKLCRQRRASRLGSEIRLRDKVLDKDFYE